jgi:hypothetical protein
MGVGEAPARKGAATAGMVGLAAITLICCIAPLIGGLAAFGAMAWLGAHRSLLAIPAAAVASGLVWWGLRRREC